MAGHLSIITRILDLFLSFMLRKYVNDVRHFIDDSNVLKSHLLNQLENGLFLHRQKAITLKRFKD